MRERREIRLSEHRITGCIIKSQAFAVNSWCDRSEFSRHERVYEEMLIDKRELISDCRVSCE